MTLTKDEISRTILCALPTGEIVGSQDNFATFHVVFTPNTVRAEYVHLLAASSMLYNVAGDIEGGLDALVEVLEKHPELDAISAPVIQWGASLRLARTVAVEGLAAVAKRSHGPQPVQSPSTEPPSAPPKKKTNILDFFRRKGVDRPKSSD